MLLRSQRGQASAEYVGVVCVVAVLLATLAATAVAAPGLTGAVMDRFRQALCIVGMDVCDAGQARARGLDPCVVLSKQRTRRLSTLLTVIRSGDGDTLRIERRSDGSYVVSAGNGPRLGVSVGASVNLGKPGKAGGSASADAEFGSGVRWEARNLAEVKALLGESIDDAHDAQVRLKLYAGALPPARVTRYSELRGGAGLAAAGTLKGDDGQSEDFEPVSGELRGAAGRSTRAGVATYYYDVAASTDGPLGDLLPAADGRRLSVAWQRSEPPVMTVTANGAKRDGRQSETVARFVLADGGNRALARRWMLTGGAVGDSAGRGLAARMRTDATVQRFTYAEEETDEGSFDLEARLGVGVGLSREATLTRRELVDARVLSLPVGGRRMDCLAG